MPFRGFFLTCLILNVVFSLLVLLLQKSLPPVVPLMYGLPVGEEQLVPRIALAGPSALAFLIAMVNAFGAKASKNPFIEKVLVGLTIVVTSLAIVTTLKVFFLVAALPGF